VRTVAAVVVDNHEPVRMSIPISFTKHSGYVDVMWSLSFVDVGLSLVVCHLYGSLHWLMSITETCALHTLLLAAVSSVTIHVTLLLCFSHTLSL
jgi:steroid 5-alpha reductase family enzyme